MVCGTRERGAALERAGHLLGKGVGIVLCNLHKLLVLEA